MSVGRLPRVLLYLVSFGLARGGLFVAPLVLANLLPAQAYGELELAQALASVGATVLALGTSGVAPLVIIGKATAARWSSVLLHQVGVALVLVAIGLLLGLGGAPRTGWLACLCTTALLLQGLWSVVLKTNSRGEASLLLDAGFWGSLACAVALGALLPQSLLQRGGWMQGGLLCYVALLLGWTLWRWTKVDRHEARISYTATVMAGAPLMWATLLALLATTSGRLGIGLLSTPQVTADYAVLFRATALPIVAHQVIVVARFRQVFEWSAQRLERKLPWVVLLVMGTVLAFALAVHWLDWLLGPAFVSAFQRHRTEGLLILAQCVLWSAIALNDLVNARSQIAASVVRWGTAYFVLALPLAWWWLSGRKVDLAVYVPVHSLVMAGYFMTQAWAMSQRGVRLQRTWTLTLGAFAGLCALAWVA